MPQKNGAGSISNTIFKNCGEILLCLDELPLFPALLAFLRLAAPFLRKFAGTFPGSHTITSSSVGLIAMC
jgi:hypothetical protein